jgi:predicted enzyme related to lactoylglutathione lyase
MGERTRYDPGTFCWVGLATSDVAAAKAFYGSLFGWEAEDREAGAAGTYATLRRGGSAARAAELGGAAVFRAPFDVLDAGRVAAIRDPTGVIVSLWQPRSRIGATLVNDTGALCWNELATTGIERAKSFFGQLLGWEYETDDSGYVAVTNAGNLNDSKASPTHDGAPRRQVSAPLGQRAVQRVAQPEPVRRQRQQRRARTRRQARAVRPHVFLPSKCWNVPSPSRCAPPERERRSRNHNSPCSGRTFQLAGTSTSRTTDESRLAR